METATKEPIRGNLLRSRSHSNEDLNSVEKNTTHSASMISLSDNSDNDYDLPADVAERLVKRTEIRVQQVLEQSMLVRQHCRIDELPRFDKTDFEIGELIAHGGFSNVFEIKSFSDDKGLEKNREFVVKSLIPKLAFDPKKLAVGAKDLVMEAHFLSSLDHVNIMQLRGWARAGVAGFAETGRVDGFFLIYDKLLETLSHRIHEWRERARSLKRSSRSSARKQLFQERIQAAMDIASAVEFLHSRRIIYRDLKPANVGYDQFNVLKIFDFGLAVELPEGSHADSTFNLAGNTGTPRYMAVEVIRRHPYNTKADVFSFSVLLWELMALSKPYDGINGQQVKECVAIFGERLAIPRTWPTNLRRILKRGWDENLIDRPTMKEAREVLEKLHEAAS